MSYTTDEKNLAATLLCKQLVGMHFAVARAWVTCEQGLNGNVFGITDGKGKLLVFNTMSAGVTATATIVKTSPLYAGIIASLKLPALEQARAIVRWPWHLGPTGLKNAGGRDPYYARVFATQGFPGL